jgi:hypothetical protein
MIRVLALAALAGILIAAAPPRFQIVPAEQVTWQALPGAPGVEAALITGDPSKPGTYVMRVKFPPHVMDRPHSHSRDRYVTVLQGHWYAGTGSDFDPVKATILGPGSFMLHPASGVHWDGSGSDETVIVQIVGEGPIQSMDVDPSKSSWVVLQEP